MGRATLILLVGFVVFLMFLLWNPPSQPLGIRESVSENYEDITGLVEIRAQALQAALNARSTLMVNGVPVDSVEVTESGGEAAAPPQDLQIDRSNPEDLTWKRGQSLTPQEIDALLVEYNSPAVGIGQTVYDIGIQYGIDGAYLVAFFIKESGAASAQGWAGWRPDGSHTYNIGNIICTANWREDGLPCHGRFRDYSTHADPWAAAVEDWYRLIDLEYIQGRGHVTVADSIPVYAPAEDNNNPAGYTATVRELVSTWRSTFGAEQINPPSDAAWALGFAENPLGEGAIIFDIENGVTYLSYDTPERTLRKPVYATHDGEVTYIDTDIVQLESASEITQYSRLMDITVNSGQSVRRGDIIGTAQETVGYQRWAKQDGSWTPVPLELPQ